jgi:hypothetical protein
MWNTASILDVTLWYGIPSRATWSEQVDSWW